ncbi:MAG: hypothetical protein QOD44_3017 [Solirubrobacteraceae bacterium]|nr:hypothetical protein [Solirubrobacteraceae bacterium]MEA2318828.1 hypothetical protein [Solirubrobacteraceae bacterium]
MTRKSISTNAPVISCDVCGRTLLPGENPDIFLAGGAKRNVCELCTQRASHEGWIREGLDDATVRSRGHNGRSRSLVSWVRGWRDAARDAREARDGREERDEPAPHDDVPHEPRHSHHHAPGAPDAPPVAREHRSVHAVPTNADLKMARALDLFNASPHPRTVAGVARSLGAPIVAVRPSATEGSVLTIVVGWELSWYRYEVDLGDEAAGVRLVTQGAELSELEPADQMPNAAADDHGGLHLVAQHA